MNNFGHGEKWFVAELVCTLAVFTNLFFVIRFYTHWASSDNENEQLPKRQDIVIHNQLLLCRQTRWLQV